MTLQTEEQSIGTVVAGTPASHDGFRVVVEPCPQRIRAVFNGETVADSTRALVMNETRLPHVFYIPREDVRMDLLTPTERLTHCPFKGNASYWSLSVGDRAVRDIAWSYEDAFDEALTVNKYIAFDWSAIDHWYADEMELTEQPRDLEPPEDNPFLNWVVKDASRASTASDLLASLARVLVSEGFPLWRLRLVIRTLNPQLFALNYRWDRNADEIEEFHATHEVRRSDQYRNSPFALIVNGEGGVRRRLEGDNPRLDFPVLKDLLEEGATDYIALPLKFSDGQTNILTLVSDRAGGFTTNQLGHLHEILPNLARQLEAHAHRTSAISLLRTYLGRNAGKRVWEGSVERGDGEDLHAVIWLSDLRGSTEMADSLPRAEYLETLNEYFDCVAGSVIDHGGEVLKFIGDAVLAIFPIDDADSDRPAACMEALAAAKHALDAMKTVNAGRRGRGRPELTFGIGLHRGNITYGNVGTDRRLDFTVIGPAVNEVARIEDLSKAVGRPVLASAEFARSVACDLDPVGNFTLRGVRYEREIYALNEEG